MLCMYVRAVVFGCIFVTSIFAVNCPKGSFISSVGCTPCPEKHYSDSVNGTKCWKCDECKGRHNLVTHVCNSTSNTKCACEPGFYWDDALFCLKCDRCKRGHGMVKNCTSDSNTVCEHCEHGKTYSDKKDFNSCKNCSICPDGYFEQRRCTRKNDTICLKDTEQNKSKNNWKIDNRGRSSGSRQRGGSKPRLKNKNSTQSPIQHSTNTSLKTFDGSSSLKSMEVITTGTEMNLVIALGVVSGFAFLVLIVTLSLMFFIRRKSRKSTKDTDKERVEDPTPSASATEVARENPYTSLPHIGTGQEKMLRDAPYTLISDLAKLLNPGGRWKELGGRLDFNNTQIGNFALVQQNATQTMLEEWGHRDCGTVVALQKLFRSMKWTKEERICAEYV